MRGAVNDRRALAFRVMELWMVVVVSVLGGRGRVLMLKMGGRKLSGIGWWLLAGKLVFNAQLWYRRRSSSSLIRKAWGLVLWLASRS